MPNPSKQKGDRWERALVNLFRERGYSHAARLRQDGPKDISDLTIGSPYWAIQAKDDRHLSPRAMAEQAEREAVNARKDYGVAIRKSPRRKTDDAVVLMTLETWLRLVDHLERQRII